MKTVKLLHNPKAGSGEHTQEELVSLIKSKGYDCLYASIKDKGWNKIEDVTDIVAIAGGDGAVRKVISKLLGNGLLDKKYPLTVLPLGTANNISKTLQADGMVEDVINSWENGNVKKIDVGRIDGLPDHVFFLEGFGLGLFPNLINRMKKIEKKEEIEDGVKTALENLLELVNSYKARPCKLEVDGRDCSGKYLLVEVMNTNRIGPNLELNPNGDPGDGMLELVLITEEQREKLAEYVQNKINGNDEPFYFDSVKAKKVTIVWEGIHAHVDDEIIKAEKQFEITIEVIPEVLDFLVPLK